MIGNGFHPSATVSFSPLQRKRCNHALHVSLHRVALVSSDGLLAALCAELLEITSKFVGTKKTIYSYYLSDSVDK